MFRRLRRLQRREGEGEIDAFLRQDIAETASGDASWARLAALVAALGMGAGQEVAA